MASAAWPAASRLPAPWRIRHRERAPIFCKCRLWPALGTITNGTTRKIEIAYGNGNGSIAPAAAASTFSGGVLLTNNARASNPATPTGAAGSITSGVFGTGAITIGANPGDKAQIYLTTNNSVIANAVIVNSAAGTDIARAFRIESTGGTVSGSITANLAPVTIGTNTGTNTLSLTGQLTGNNGFTIGGGGTLTTVTYNNASANNNYQGDTNVNANGALVLGAANQLPNGTTAGNLNIATGVSVTTGAAFSQTINGLSGAGSFNGTAANTATLTINGTYFTGLSSTTQATFSGVIGNTGTINVVKAGTGLQVFSGVNTYTGTTSVTGGQLTVSAGSMTNSTGLSVSTGAQFTYAPASAMAMAANSPLNLAAGSILGESFAAAGASTTIGVTTGVATATTGTVYIAVGDLPTFASGTALTLIQAASGLNGGAAFSVLNPTNFSYAVTVAAGSVKVTPTFVAQIGTGFFAGNIVAANPGMWAASQAGGFASNWTTTTGGTATALVPGSGATVTIDVNTNPAVLGSMTLGANMSIKGFSNSNAGTVTLNTDTASHTLTIGTSGIGVTAGTVTLSPNIILGGIQSWTNSSGNLLTVGGTGTVVNGSTFALTIAGNSATTINNYIGSTGGITSSATATLTLAGVTAFSGAATIAHNSSNATTISGILNTGGNTLTINGTGAGGTAITANISGAGTLAIGGTTQTVTFSGNNTYYTGATTVASGNTLILTGTNSTGSTTGFTPTLAAQATTVTGTLQLQANVGNTANGVSTVFGGANAGNTTTNSNMLNLANNSTLQLRSDNTVTFGGTSGIGGLNNVTVTIDVNRVGTSATNQVLSLMPFGSAFASAVTVNVTGGNGYSLALGAWGNVLAPASTLTFNPTTASVSVGGFTANATSTAANTLVLGGTAAGNSFTGAITDSAAGTTGVTSVTKNSSSTWSINAGSSYSGSTLLQNGTLVVGTTNALPVGTTVSFGSGSFNGILDLGGNNQQVGGLAVVGNTPASQIIGNSSTVTPSLLIYAGGTSTFGGTIQNVIGSGTQTVGLGVTSGTLTLTGANTYTGTTTINGGALVLNNANPLNNTAIATGAPGSSLSVTGAANIGLTTVSAGGATLTLNNGTAFSMIDGAIATVNLQQGTSFAGAALTISGGATLSFDLGTSTADKLAVTSTASVAGTNKINIAAIGASLTPGSYDVVTATSGLSGTYNFFATGTTTETVVAGANSYVLTLSSTTAAVTVTVGSGTPLVGSLVWTGQTNGTGTANSSWDTAGSYNWANGSTPINYSNSNPVIFQDTNPANGGAAISNSTVSIQAAGVTPTSVTFNNSSVNYIVGNASGAIGIAGSASVTMTGTASVTLNGTNTFTGGLVIQAGTVVANASGALGGTSGTGAVTLGFTSGTAAATLNVGATGLTIANPITLATNATVGALTIGTTTGAIASTFSGAITGGAAGTNANLTINNQGTGILTFATGGINNTGSVTNAGTGTNTVNISSVIGANVTSVTTNSPTSNLGLSNASNAYTGGTFVTNSQVLAQATDGAVTGVFGPIAKSITLNNGTLSAELAGGVTLNAARSIILGTGTTSGGALSSGSGGTLTVNGSITGTGPLAINWDLSGVVILANAGNNYSGDTQIGNAGLNFYNNASAVAILKAGVANPWGASGPTTGNLVVGYNAGTDTGAGNIATFDLNGFNVNINGLSSGGGAVPVVSAQTLVNNSSATAVTLTLGNHDATATFGGVIKNTSGALSITKVGTGTQTFSGANTYTGSTTVSVGTLTLGVGGSVQTNAVTVSTGAILNLSGGANNQLNNVAPTGALIVDGTLNVTTNIANTLYFNTITMDNGTLANTFGQNTSGFGALYVGANRTITANGASNTISGLGVIGIGSTFTLTLSTPLITDAVNVTGTLGQGASGTAGSLAKTGLGTANLSGVNTYTGSTTITGGTLKIGGAGSLGAGTYAGAIANGGTLQYSSSADQYLLSAITGTGSVIKDTSATSSLILGSGGSIVNTQAITVTAGTLNIGATSGGRTITNSMILNGGIVQGTQDNAGSGGTITIAGGLVTHTFNSSGTLTVNGSVIASGLVVGGGGGGNGGVNASYYGSGGGGGKVLNFTGVSLSSGSVTVGAGGTAGTGSGVNGTAGGSSSIGGQLAAGGSTGVVTTGAGGASGSGKAGGSATPGGAANGYGASGGGGDSAAGGTATPGAAGTGGPAGLEQRIRPSSI